jgi:hypothetical protein
MSLRPSDTLSVFLDALRSKMDDGAGVAVVRFRDEDGDMVTLRDEGDYEAAVDVARAMRRGGGRGEEGRLEVWVD